MTNWKYPRYGLLPLGAGIALAAAGWLGYGAGGLLTATPNTTGYSTDTTTPSIPSTTLSPLTTPPSPTAAPTLPPAPPAPPSP